jgi:hypothetical protein
MACKVLGGAIVLVASLSAAATSAATILADTVIDYFDSGAGPLAGPYGGTFVPANYPVPVPLSYATDGDANTFVSLPTGSYLVLGFTGGFVFDGPGNDLFISEPGDGQEDADVFVSSDFGTSFTFLGKAFGNQLTELDLADIAYAGQVNAVKIVGLDNGGGSPGFDVAFVQGLEGSVVPTIPLPATLPMAAAGFWALALLRRRRSA